MIYITSDLHFNHNKEFIYAPRGFTNVQDMNNTIIQNFNEIVKFDDDVYILGDLMLGGADKQAEGLELISALNGKLHLVRGNHDTEKRWAAYKELHNVVETDNAIYLNYRKYHFYMSHFPTMTANLEKESLHQCTINLFGHTHQITNFYNEIPFMYHVGLDSHNMAPVLLDDAIEEMKKKVIECKNELGEEPDGITYEAPTLITNVVPRPRCEKCVYSYPGCGHSDSFGQCRNYRRDPPDGGYYE